MHSTFKIWKPPETELTFRWIRMIVSLEPRLDSEIFVMSYVNWILFSFCHFVGVRVDNEQMATNVAHKLPLGIANETEQNESKENDSPVRRLFVHSRVHASSNKYSFWIYSCHVCYGMLDERWMSNDKRLSQNENVFLPFISNFSSNTRVTNRKRANIVSCEMPKHNRK